MPILGLTIKVNCTNASPEIPMLGDPPLFNVEIRTGTSVSNDDAYVAAAFMLAVEQYIYITVHTGEDDSESEPDPEKPRDALRRLLNEG